MEKEKPMISNIWYKCTFKLKIESWLKAFFAALIFGFGVLFVSSLAIWLTGFKFVWLSVIL